MWVRRSVLCGFLISLCVASASLAQAGGETNKISCSSPGKDFDSDDGYKYYPIAMTCKHDCRTAPFTDCYERTKILFGIFRLSFFPYERTCFCAENQDLVRGKPLSTISSIRSMTDRDRARLLESDLNSEIEMLDDQYLVVTLDRACSPQTTSVVDPS